MGVPAAAPVTSTAGATRIIVLVNAVQRDELLNDECAPPTPRCCRAAVRPAVCAAVGSEARSGVDSVADVLGSAGRTATINTGASSVPGPYCCAANGLDLPPW